MAKKLAPNYIGLDPMTGLPVSDAQEQLNLKSNLDVFKSTGQFVKPSLPSLSTSPIQTSSLEDFQELPKFAGWDQGAAEDVRAEDQSWYSSLGNGIARFGLTTGTKLLSGVAGIGEFAVSDAVKGLSSALGEGEAFQFTPLSDAINSVEEAIKKAFPVYNTREQQGRNFLHRAVSDLSFWTNDMVDGAAFMASAWLTGMGAGKLLGLGTKALYGAQLEEASAAEASKLAELEKAAAAGDEAAKIKLTGNALAKGQLAKNYGAATQATTALFSRAVEGISEGKQTYNTVYNDLLDKGYSDQEAKDEAGKAAMLVTGLNMFLTPLDYDQYSGWFKTYSKAKSNLLRLGETGALEVAVPSFGKAFAKHAAKNAFTEGILEEGLQAAMQNYAQKKYVDGAGDDPLSGILKEYFKGFTTKEGWDAMGSGMILGGLFGGLTEAKGEAGKQQREQANYLKTMIQNNEYLKENMADYVINDEKTGKPTLNKAKILGLLTEQLRDGYFSKQMVTALGNDYEEAYKALDNIRFSNWAYSHFEAGRAEDLHKKIDDIGNMNYEDLVKKGMIPDDMKNSEGRTVTPAEVAERYRKKALEYEDIYNHINSRFDIPNRKVGRQLFDEAVLQKESITSLDKINSKIEAKKAEILKTNTAMMPENTPLEKLEAPVANSEQEKELTLLTNRKKDLVNTLKDSYKRVDKMTIPAEIEKERLAALKAKQASDKNSEDAEQAKKNAEAAAKAKTQQIANFFAKHNDKVFKDHTVGEGENAVTDDFTFGKDEEGNVNPNVLIGLNSKKVVDLESTIDSIDMSKAVTKAEYTGAKNVIARIAKIEELVEKDRTTQLELLEKSVQIEQELEKVIAEIKELESYSKYSIYYKRNKDSKSRKVGAKVYTAEEYQQTLDKAIELRDTYQKQLEQLNDTYNELEDNISFLTEYRDYLADPTVTAVEKMKSLEQFEESAIDDMIKFSNTTIKELEGLSKEYANKAAAVSEKLSYLNNLIKSIQDILTRKKLERAIITQKLSDAATFEDFLRTLPADIRDSLYREDFEAIRAFKNYDKLSPVQQTELSKRAKDMLDRNPDLVLAILDKVSPLESELSYLTEELELTSKEAAELGEALQQYTALAEKYNNDFKDLKNVQALANNQARLKEAFSKIRIKFDNVIKVKQDTKTKAKKTEKSDLKVEPTNLSAEEFEAGLPDQTGPIRDIQDVMNGTRGNNMLRYEDGSFDDNILTNDENQRRWFRTTENLDVSQGYTLRAVSKNNNPFGSKLEKAFYDNNTILLVLYDKNGPVTEGNELIFTTMALTPTLEEVNQGRYTNKKANKGKGYTNEQLTALFENFEALRNKILNSEEGEGIYFKVTDKSGGVLNNPQVGPVAGRIVAKDSDIEDVNLVVVKSSSESIGGKIFKSLEGKKGFVLIGHKGQIVKVNLPTMEELGAVDFLMAQFETIANNFNKGETAEEKKKSREAYLEAIKNISSLINYGNVDGAEFSTQRVYFDFMGKSPTYGKFIFNGKEFDLDQVNREELRAFFAQKLFNVNSSKLAETEEYVDPFSGKTFPTYKHYLMSAENRNVEEIPIKVNLGSLSEQQFLNVYLKFNSNILLSKSEEEVEYELNIDDDTKAEDIINKFSREDTGTFQSDSSSREDDLFSQAFADYDEMEQAGIIGGEKRKKISSTEAETKAEKESENFTTEETAKEETETTEKPYSVYDDKEKPKGPVVNPWDDPEPEAPFKLFEDESPATQAVLDAEEAWFKRTFPQFADDYQRVKGLIANQAIGQVTTAGKVLISDMAVPGTTYHEAFHKVSLFLLSPSERAAIYKDYLNRVKLNLTKIEIEEGLAEAFRSYMLTGSTGLSKATESLFQKIVRLIKEFFVGKLEQEGAIENLFKNIKDGKFANSPVISRPSRAYNKVAGVSIEFSEEANQVLTRYFINALLKNNADIDLLDNLHKVNVPKIYEEAFNDIKTDYLYAFDVDHKQASKQYNKTFTEDEWKKFKESYDKNINIFLNPSYRNSVISKHAAYLSQFGIGLETVENNNDGVDKDDSTPQTPNAPDWVESVKFSPKQNMRSAVKLLVLSLTDKSSAVVDGKTRSVNTKSKFFGIPKITNFEQTMNYLQEKLVGLTTAEDMISKLQSLQSFNPVLRELLGKLKMTTEPFAVGQSLSDTLTQIAFVEQFAKTKNKYLLTMINSDTGEIYQIDATSEALKDKMLSIWKAKSKENLETEKSFYTLDASSGRYIFNRKKFVSALEKGFSNKYTGEKVPYNVNDVSQNLALLKNFGIVLTRKEGEYTLAEKHFINKATARIIEYYAKKEQVGIDDMFQSDDIRSWIVGIAELELPYTTEAIELSHLNPEGETVYSISLNNFLSMTVNSINNNGIESLEHLANDPYSENSIWKRIISKDKQAIQLVNLEGTKMMGSGERGKITSELTPGDLIVTHFNNIMNNIYPLLRAGDKKLEYGFAIDINAQVKDYLNVFKGYLADELSRVVDFRMGDRNNIDVYNKQAMDLVTFYFLQDRGVIKDLHKMNKSDIPKIVNSVAVENALKGYIKDRVTENIELLKDNNIVTKTKDGWVNNGISKSLPNSTTLKKVGSKLSEEQLNNLIEEFTVRQLIGNIEQTKLFLGDLAFFNHAKNDGPKRVGGTTGTKRISVVGDNLNKWLSKFLGKPVNGKVNVAVFEDPTLTPEAFIENAKNFFAKEGILVPEDFFDEYYDIKTADAQGYITLPAYKEFLIRANQWSMKHENAYATVLAGGNLDLEDLQLFQPLKPQYYGPQASFSGFTPFFLKFSLVPLLPKAIKGTKLEEINKLMMSKDIGIATFNSGAKVGAKVTKGLIVDGKVNTELSPDISTIDYKYFGIQLDIAPEFKRKVTIGTQFRKLLLSNLMPQGNSKLIRVVDPATNKVEMKETESLVNEYDKTVEDLTKIEIKDLLDRLKIERKDGGYIVKDPVHFKKILMEEANKRGASLNVRLGIEVAIDAANFNLDVLSNKTKVEFILSSILNNSLVKQKTFGDMKVQMSGFGTAKTTVKESGDLKMYSVSSKGVTKIQVRLPHWFKEIYGKDVDIKSIDPRLLNIVAYRIPTQDYSSMDVLEVVGFLPVESGNVIQVPEGFPAKGGSDFDIDKMNLFLPNYEVIYNKEEALKSINSELRKFFRGEPGYKLASVEELENILAKEEDADFTVKERKIISYYNRYIREATPTFKYVESSGDTKAAKQNKIIELATQILTSPDNYASLIKPNTNKTLKGLANEVLGEKPSGKGPRGKMLEFATNIKTALSFWGGKTGVGIAALHNAHHTLSQKVNLHIPFGTMLQKKIFTGFYAENRGGYTYPVTMEAAALINFKHNKSADGGISFAHEYDNQTDLKISDLLAEFINAYVDIAKDPFILNLNAGTDTANIWLTLLRAGVPAKDLAYFMAQPIITDYLKLSNLYNSQFLKAKGKEKSKSEILNTLTRKYNIKQVDMQSSGVLKTTKDLKQNIEDKLTNPEYNASLLKDFLIYEQIANDMSDIMKVATFDTAGVGKTRWHSRALLRKVNSTLKSTMFKNADKILTDTTVKPFYEVAKMAANFYNQGYAIDSAKTQDLAEWMFDQVDHVRDTQEQGKLLSYIENEFLTYLFSTTKANGISFNADIQRLFLGENSMAHRLNSLKTRESLKNNFLINQLVPIINNNRKSTDNIKLFDSAFNSYQADLAYQAFAELFNHPEKQIRDFASDLLKLMLLQGGPNFSPVSLYNFIPNDLFIEKFSRVVLESFKTSSKDISSFKDEFYLNNWHKSEFVPWVPYEGDMLKGYVTLNRSNMAFGRPYIKSTFTLPNGEKQVKLFAKVREDSYSAEYMEVDKRGNGFYLREYYGDLIPSKIPDNVSSKKPKLEQTSKIKKPKKYLTDAEQVERATPKIKAAITEQIAEFANKSAEKYVPKEQEKSKIATQFIGDGVEGSSTDIYKNIYKQYGIANTGKYTAKDVIFVSSNGKRSNRVAPIKNNELQGVYKNIDKAIKAKATIVMDTAEHLENTKDYNIGELALADYLTSKGYIREDKTGIWRPADNFTTLESPLKCDKN